MTVECPAHVECGVLVSFNSLLQFLQKCAHPNGCGEMATLFSSKKVCINCWLISSDTKLMNSNLNWNIRICVICCRFATHTNETRLSLNEVWIVLSHVSR